LLKILIKGSFSNGFSGIVSGLKLVLFWLNPYTGKFLGFSFGSHFLNSPVKKFLFTFQGVSKKLTRLRKATRGFLLFPLCVCPPCWFFGGVTQNRLFFPPYSLFGGPFFSPFKILPHRVFAQKKNLLIFPANNWGVPQYIPGRKPCAIFSVYKRGFSTIC